MIQLTLTLKMTAAKGAVEKRQSTSTTVLFRTMFTRTIMLNLHNRKSWLLDYRFTNSSVSAALKVVVIINSSVNDKRGHFTFESSFWLWTFHFLSLQCKFLEVRGWLYFKTTERRNFTFHLKPVILRRVSTAWKNLLKVDFEDMIHEKAGLCCHLLMRQVSTIYTNSRSIW